MDDINALQERALRAIADSNTLQDIEQQRVQLLGKKGKVTEILKGLGTLPVEERKELGQKINTIRDAILEALQQKKSLLEQSELTQKIAKESIDVTLKGRAVSTTGLHPIHTTLARMKDIFAHMGFQIAIGPEIEDEFYNFEALNIPKEHPAREMHDTFYFENGTLLRTHTSPVQIRTMLNQKPPFQMIAPGRVYRCDHDVTHSPMFHQVEGLVISKDANFSELKGVLSYFLNAFFEKSLRLRFRPSYFPFTEPSAEVDIECVLCQGKGCRVCKQTGWLEVLGCGMVHPHVFKAVGYVNDEWYGYAFGMGVERLAMLYYGIPDLRLFYENHLQFLAQFS